MGPMETSHWAFTEGIAVEWSNATVSCGNTQILVIHRAGFHLSKCRGAVGRVWAAALG